MHHAFLLIMLILLGVWHLPSDAGEIQYHLQTTRITGFRQGTGMPTVAGYGVLAVADNFPATIGLPAACVGVPEALYAVTVTATNPVAVNVPASLACFGGVVVTTKAQLDAKLLEILQTQVPQFRTYVAEQCPIADVTARCQRFRAVAQRLDPSADAIDTMIQQALAIRSQLP